MKNLFFLLIGTFFILYVPSSALAQTKSIDCNNTPNSLGSSWTVVSHQKDGEYVLDSTKIATKLVQVGTPNHPIKGKDMLIKLGDTGLNACVYEFILEHQELAPKVW